MLCSWRWLFSIFWETLVDVVAKIDNRSLLGSMGQSSSALLLKTKFINTKYISSKPNQSFCRFLDDIYRLESLELQGRQLIPWPMQRIAKNILTGSIFLTWNRATKNLNMPLISMHKIAFSSLNTPLAIQKISKFV